MAVDDLFYTCADTGETVSLNSDGLFFGTALSMRGYAFENTASLYGITNVSLKPVEASVDVTVYDRTEWDVLRRLAVRDTFKGLQGTFTALDKLGNRWTRKGNFTSDSLQSLPADVMNTTMGIKLYGMWVKESWIMVPPDTSGNSGNWLDYPYDYPFDYGTVETSRTFTVGGSLPAHAVIRIYGHCTNPKIKINNNLYGVNTTVGSGERLDIDTYAKTIKRTVVGASDVNIIDEYANRVTGNELSNSYVFQTIPLGENTVTWNGGFGFDIIVREQEAETPWIL